MMAAQDQEPDWVEQLIRGLNNQNRKPVSCPTFDGSTDVSRFLQIFAEVAEANKWDNNERALRLKLALKGTAAECAHGETAEEIAESLMSRYQLTREESRRELRHLKLKAGQDIHLFGNLVLKLVRMAEPDLEPEQLDERATAELIDAIGDRLLTREFRLQGPINFADAIRRIQQYNTDMKVSRVNRLTVGEELEGKESAMEMEIKALKQKYEALQDSMNKMGEEMKTNTQSVESKLDKLLDKETEKQKPVCFNCNEPGHVIRQCPAPRQNWSRPTRQLYCQNCQRQGHSTQQCRTQTRPDQQWSGDRRTCYICGQGGHISRNCMNQQLSNNRQSALNSRGPQ